MTTSAPHANGAEHEADVGLILELIRQLAPGQRRVLLRRLRVSGLWEPHELLTDQNRLHVAPALARCKSTAAVRQDAAQQAVNGATAATSAAAADAALHGAEYHSPVRGRIIVGTPDIDQHHPTQADDPHAMLPLPGRAPQQPISIIFDGGSQGNPGRGYGSYALQWPGAPRQIVRLQFGDMVTNNEAEYDTLIAALEALLQRLRDRDADPATASVQMRGDSQLVINQVLGQWQCKQSRLRARRDRVRTLLQEFGTWQLSHHAREHSVEVLGH